MEILISNIDYKEVGVNSAFMQHKAISLIGENSPSLILLNEILIESLSMRIDVIDKKDFTLQDDELKSFKLNLTSKLEKLVAHLPEIISDSKDVYKLNNKKIQINIRDRNERKIAAFLKILEIAEDCIDNCKPMYFAFFKSV